jgi:DNA-directed RNA polymerase subunit RPC12/RpoP
MKSTAAHFAYTTTTVTTTFRLSMRRLTCRVFGHRFADHKLTEAPWREKLCSCGESLLRADGTATHVRHNLACFLGGHSYTKIGERSGHCEYICGDCGHPLMFDRETSTYARRERFRKSVRHRCGWFGHVVHEVTERSGLTEYACHCGHSFLLQAKGLTRVRHPLLCVTTGHRIRLLSQRNGQLEFRCRDCGHPFCLADGAGQFQSPSTTELASSARAQGFNWLRLIRFPYHLSFVGVVLGAALIAKGLPASLLPSLLALYLSFNALLYGGLYTLNDILDAESDRRHPRKRNRPIQSGAISRRSAALFAATMAAGGLVSGYALFPAPVFYIYLAVLAINVCYSAVARKIPWLELVFNAAPHPLRFAMGAALAGGIAPYSLLTGIFLLAFGIAATRRLLEKDAQGWQAREVIESYSERDFFLLRLAPFCVVFLQLALDSSIPKTFYVIILAVYAIIVFGVDFLRPVRLFFVELWTK